MINLSKNLYFALMLFLLSYSASAVELIRGAIITYSTDPVTNIATKNTNFIDISLYDNDAPITVTNFTSNIDTGTFDNLFFNRNIANFFAQAGGYSFNPDDGGFSYTGGVFNGGLQPTAAATTIDNEFKLSNLRGTLAMAKDSGDTRSSALEWFINLSDNTFLDDSFVNANDGFTVFGEILDNGMETVDQIASIPTFDLTADIDLDSAFSDIALVDFTSGSNTNDINDKNLVKINFSRLFKVTDIVDFDEAIPNNTVQRDIVISNTSSNPLNIGSFNSALITPPFSVISDSCSPTPPITTTTLGVSEQCNILIEFTPLTADFYESTGSIDIQTHNRTIPIRLKTPGPDIKLSIETIDFGFQPVYEPDQGLPPTEVIWISNTGERDLSFSSIQFDSLTPEEFVFTDNCTRDNNEYLPGKVSPESICVLVLNFKPTDLLLKSATISIYSDDPDEAEIVINVTGGSNTDNDGIDNAIEDAAPNNGDGNLDGNPDRLQNNVVSFASTNGIYTTLLTDEEIAFTNVKQLPLDNLNSLPDGVSLENEAFSFELTGIPAGAITRFGMILPVGNSPTNIYSYGPTSTNDVPHWYALEKDTIPGVLILGNASLTDDATNIVQKNITTITIQDGGDGDSDQLVNGKIAFVGGPEITNQGSSTAGSLLWLLFLVPIPILAYRR